MQAAAAPRLRPLFGGALSAVLPSNITDISELREIPDNQEVFAHPHTDQSLIVELLEYQGQVADQDAARFHFEDIAGSNKAQGPGASVVGNAEAIAKGSVSLSECSSAWMLRGTQSVSKFNEEARNTVSIHLGLLRLPQFSTDILMTFNDPLSISPDSSSSMTSDSSSRGGAEEARREPWTEEDFQRALLSLTLHNPGLFG
ncbi:ran guanine nucleotide release factor [Cyprinodon tularosa]|uniref:ran guanine nucleotide release factor n=1 Tax=Cyprinodon tularosa TaxID=77115 RepID=UPI0018E28B85|nr:ran guanine nucleotide release factor [Cyprinodon tularosa]